MSIAMAFEALLSSNFLGSSLVLLLPLLRVLIGVGVVSALLRGENLGGTLGLI